MVTASVPVKARVPNIINIVFLQVNMVCIDKEFFVVRVARLKPWVNIQGISTSHNCHSMGCAGSKPRPGRIPWILRSELSISSLNHTTISYQAYPICKQFRLYSVFSWQFWENGSILNPPPQKKFKSKFKIQKWKLDQLFELEFKCLSPENL